MSSRDLSFRALCMIPVSIIYGSPAGSRVTLMFLCSNSARNQDPRGSTCQKKAAPRPALLTVRPLFLWLLPGNVSRPFAVHFPESEWLQASALPWSDQGDVLPCRVLQPLLHWSQMAGPDPRAGWRTCTAKAFKEGFIISKCTFVTRNF